jgi:hypothetical protein
MALELQQDLAFLDQPTSVVTISFNEANVCVCVCARARERERFATLIDEIDMLY